MYTFTDLSKSVFSKAMKKDGMDIYNIHYMMQLHTDYKFRFQTFTDIGYINFVVVWASYICYG